MFDILAPPSWVVEPTDSEIIEGEKLSLPCLAEGYPNPQIFWWRIGMPNSNLKVSSWTSFEIF